MKNANEERRRPAEPGEFGYYKLLSPPLTKIFPKRWSSELGSEDVAMLLDVNVGGPPTRGEFCPAGWSLARFERLVEAQKQGRNEASRVGRDGRLMLLFEEAGPDPVGGLVFDLTIYVTRALSIKKIWIDLTLAWISPDHRGRGLGTRLSAHLCDYLDQHPLQAKGIKIPRRGVEVIIDADWSSAGGKRITDHLHDYVEALAELSAFGGPTKDGWPIRSVDLDAGY